MPDSLIAPHIQASFDRQSMMATFGATLVAAADGRAVIRAPLMPGVRQQHGAGHAALTFGIGDTAAGYAALSLMPAGREVMTAEIKINLLSPALGDWFEAVGEVVKTGRRLSVVRAEVVAITGAARKTIAVLQGTMVPVDPAPQ